MGPGGGGGMKTGLSSIEGASKTGPVGAVITQSSGSGITTSGTSMLGGSMTSGTSLESTSISGQSIEGSSVGGGQV